MTPPAGIQVIGPLRPSLDATPPGAEAPPVPLEKASAVPEAPSGTETATQPEAAEPMVKSSPEPAPQPAAEAPVSQPGAESPATEAPAEASPAAESRKPVEGVQSCRIIVSPFPNFTVLIKFDEVLKKLPEIQRLRSRSFRAGRLEVALDCDSQRSLVESLERNTEVPLHLVSETGDTLVFNLSDTQIPAPR